MVGIQSCVDHIYGLDSRSCNGLPRRSWSDTSHGRTCSLDVARSQVPEPHDQEDRYLTIKKIDGKKNCADLGTKSHTAGEPRRLCEMNYLMSEENIKRPPIAEVNTVGAVGGTSVRSALIALLAALIAGHSEPREHRVALKSAVAFDLVDATQQSDVLTMRISTFVVDRCRIACHHFDVCLHDPPWMEDLARAPSSCSGDTISTVRR